MNDAHQPRLDAPKLRTLLLTDLCGSTELVEKLGDSAAEPRYIETLRAVGYRALVPGSTAAR